MTVGSVCGHFWRLKVPTRTAACTQTAGYPPFTTLTFAKMPRNKGISSSNARKLKRLRTAERLRNEDKLIDKSNERSIQYIDRIFDVKFTAKLARRNEKSKQKSKSKRKSQNKSAPFAQPGVGHAPIESDTKIESTAMTVAYRDSEKTQRMAVGARRRQG